MPSLRLLLAALAVLALIWLYVAPSGQALVAALGDSQTLQRWLDQLAGLGPLAVVLLMAFAIVFNPIPSAPIALAAGAVFGHAWGTLYIVLGAELGAIVAFGIARFAGYELLKTWLGKRFSDRIETGLWGDQNRLTALVFISRLLPFLSFDLISYGAGLTPIRFWRFAAATLLGLIPMSFLLAHFGAELKTTGLARVMPIALALGVLTLGSSLWAAIRARR
jgi:uncharacterized membrane protein YdjX (TVP38/TMEM64 family)